MCIYAPRRVHRWYNSEFILGPQRWLRVNSPRFLGSCLLSLYFVLIFIIIRQPTLLVNKISSLFIIRTERIIIIIIIITATYLRAAKVNHIGESEARFSRS